MTHEIAYRSQDFTNVEPVLVSPSGGTNPNAAVAWEELQAGLATKLSPLDLENALANLFEEILLTNGVTEERPGTDGTNYFFTRFDIVVPGWATNKLNEIALIERATGIQRNYGHLFQVTGAGSFFVEFESKRSNPVIPDDAYLIRVQRLPEPGVLNFPGWLSDTAARVGAVFLQVYDGLDTTGAALFKNGNSVTEENWYAMNYGEQEAFIGVRQNGVTNAYEAI